MRKLLFVVLIFMLQTLAVAGNVQYMNLTVNKASVSFALAEKPVVTYTNDELTVTTAREKVSVKMAELQEWTFSDVPTAIERTQFAEPQLLQGKVLLGQLKPGSKAELYNYKGEVVRSAVVSSEGEVQLEYGSLPSGVYLIKTVAYTIKIRNNK